MSPFIRSGQNHLARHNKRGKKTRRTKEEVGRQHQGMDRPGVRQVPEGSGEQGRLEKTGCKIICGAPTTLAVKGLMMMMMCVCVCVCACAGLLAILLSFSSTCKFMIILLWRYLHTSFCSAGIYIQSNDVSVAEKYRGIGIRIEDNILVTETTPVNLSQNCPKTVDEIERLMNKRWNKVTDARMCIVRTLENPIFLPWVMAYNS